MEKLVLFDLDGTLIESMKFDADCYVEAVRLVLGIVSVDTDWSHYHNVTDAGILAEIHRMNFHREIGRDPARKVKESFVRIIKARLQSEKIRLKPLRGAGEALRVLQASDRWMVALATGGWRESAEVKLRNAGLPVNEIPIFSANDSISRPGILQAAVQAMLKSEKIKRFEKIVYVGDGVWDVWAAREMKVAFVGVGTGTKILLREGAGRVVRDYSDLKKFLTALETSTIP
ncbi:MAG: HAD family hydrolase [Proteobacteria bacterium]|nr:HAD family hydrolase [Pseudomonadota bacterium]